MSLKAESKLGPYEIVGLLGTGGMGEVYRARDKRLGREVAIKMLLSSGAVDQERLRRFEQEAKAVALLNHPGILQIYDTGVHHGMPFLVMELLEGQTLRARLKERPLSLRKSLDYGQQIARGLAAAHEKGLMHRDLKPENVFITQGDRVKILDFGLAKFCSPVGAEADRTMGDCTMPLETEPGMVVGTVGYMSPEQVTGRPVDHRSDLFALGVMLWEMIGGQRPFHGDSAVEVMHAILKDDPPELSLDLQLPLSLRRTLLRCLEKDPCARFQSAQDLAFELENATLGATSTAALARVVPKWNRRRVRAIAIGGIAILATLGTAFWVGSRLQGHPPPILRRLTYRTGDIQNARLAPDGRSFVYSLSEGADPGRLWVGRMEGPGARSLELPLGTEILSIASTGEMALLLRPLGDAAGIGTLARAPLSGGAPREILEQVRSADWSPDGQQLAVVRVGEEGQQRLEYPIGHRLFEAAAANAIDGPKVSPKGDLVAFTEIVAAGNQALSVVDARGHREILARGEIQSMAWEPNGRGLIFTLRLPEDRQELRTVSLSGRQRLVYSVLGRLSIQDVSRAGKVLLRHSLTRQHLFLGQRQGKAWERSWLQSSKVADLGTRGILFAETREGDGPGGAYFRKTDALDAVRLGDGDPLVLSPDGKWAVVRTTFGPAAELALLPTGPGEVHHLPSHGVKAEWAAFLDLHHLLLGGAGPDKVFRYYVQELSTGELRPWQSAPGHAEAYCLVSPDGTRVMLGPVDGKLQLYRPDGALIREIQGFSEMDVPLQWGARAQELYVGTLEGLPAKIWRVDLTTGRRGLWMELMPSDRVGVRRLDNVCLSHDGDTYAYSFLRTLTSDLYLMEGWQ